MAQTPNYNLNKPGYEDFGDVDMLNENFEKIDKVLAATDPTKITAKAAPADGDGVMIADSADGGKAKRLLWSNVKEALGKLFVPLARKINGKALSADVTLTGENIAVSTTDSTPISGAVKYRTNPNLLDDGYFVRPVNQRGKTEYIDGATYSIDRWWLQYGTHLSIVDGGVKLSGNWDIQQYFENTFPNATYTLSLLYKDKTGSDALHLTFANRSSGDIAVTSSKDASGLLRLTFTTDKLDKVAIGFTGSTDNSATLIAAKLELGDTQTLAHKENGVWVLNEVPDYGEQLARCMRYYIDSLHISVNESNKIMNEVWSTGSTTGSSIHYSSGAQFPVVMRTTPVVTLYSVLSKTANKVSYGSSGLDISATPTVCMVGETGFAQILIEGVDDPLNGNQVQFFYTASADL